MIGFLKGPEWALPVMSFIDENCIIFDSEEENKLAYMDIYAAFRMMVESLMELHLQDMGCTTEQFAQLCATCGSTNVGREVVEQILAVDDFVSFKKMMVKRNMELELESLKALQALSERLASGQGGTFPDDGSEEDSFERQLQVQDWSCPQQPVEMCRGKAGRAVGECVDNLHPPSLLMRTLPQLHEHAYQPGRLPNHHPLYKPN